MTCSRAWAGRSSRSCFASIDALGAVRQQDRLRRVVADSPARIDSGPLHYSVSIGATMLDARDEGYEGRLCPCGRGSYTR